MTRRKYVFRDGQIIEVTGMRARHKLYPVDKAVMDNRDAVMSVGGGEAKYVADQSLNKLIQSGDFDKMYSPDKK